MSIFDSFKSSDLQSLGATMADDVARRFPPTLENAKSGGVSANRVTNALERAYAKAEEIHKANPLGWFRKAKLGQLFKLRLQELGYSEAFVDVATEGLIVTLTKSGKSSSVR